MSDFYRNYGKRAIDFTCAGLVLLVIWPLLILLAILVKIDSKGPAVFVQDRLTLGGRVFHMYKFRTMCVNAEQQGTGAYSFGNDPRIYQTTVKEFIKDKNGDLIKIKTV